MYGADDSTAALPRIIVVAPMKSGSTRVANVVGRYFEITEPLNVAVQVDFEAQHDLTPWLFLSLRGKSFCFNLHMLAHRRNILTAAEEHIALLGVWRNLGDMIVSLDDHGFREGGNGPALFMLGHEKFLRLPVERRHAFLIDTVVPWYLRFYLGWRSANLTLHPYEQMLIDPSAHFAGMVAPLLTHPPIDALLAQSVAGKGGAEDRLNVGRAGRSAEKLSASNKRRLEEKILLHPDYEQLEVLLYELAWEVPELEPRAALDGRTVFAGDAAQPFFIARGRAHPVRASWLATRFAERRTPQPIDAAELARYPRGEPLL